MTANLQIPSTLIDAIKQDAWSRVEKLPAPRTTNDWPIDYSRVLAWRARKLFQFEQDPSLIPKAKEYYSTRCVEFINHWLDTHDPREAGKLDASGMPIPVTRPFVLFQRQDEMVQFIMQCIDREAPGLIEKSRDMGATWLCIGVSIWMWLFWPGSSMGWGSATAIKLDRSGDASSIFQKIEMCIKGIPECFKPNGLKPKEHLLQMRAYNPENGASIVGEIGDNIGRGGRTRAYFVDEAAFLEHPEEVDKALSENTRVRIDMSTVSGLGTVFHRTRQGGVDWEPGNKVVRGRTNVLVLDWRHHPAKGQAWADERRAYWESKGMPHVFEAEVERNYAAGIEGTILPRKWLDACVDAHKKLGFTDEGGWTAGLDVADSGKDRNACVARKGWVVKKAGQWAERDTALTTRRCLALLHDCIPCSLQYDCIGVGAGIKAESNRLKDDGTFPKNIKLTPWNAGAAVLNPGERVIPLDDKSPTNKNFYANMKAQGWWTLRTRVYNTFRAVTEGEHFDEDELISFDKESIGGILVKLLEELGQATASMNTRMKLIVDKDPDGAMSPNLGDACMMCCFPADRGVLTASAFQAPIMVAAVMSDKCTSCGSRRVHALGRGRLQCLACGFIGEPGNSGGVQVFGGRRL
jgi:hypothetical protein